MSYIFFSPKSSPYSSIARGASKLNCESYELGKYHCASYPCRVNPHSSVTFELIDYDVWGPYHFSSFKGFR